VNITTPEGNETTGGEVPPANETTGGGGNVTQPIVCADNEVLNSQTNQCEVVTTPPGENVTETPPVNVTNGNVTIPSEGNQTGGEVPN
jgi:hypothetical protein